MRPRDWPAGIFPCDHPDTHSHTGRKPKDRRTISKPTFRRSGSHSLSLQIVWRSHLNQAAWIHPPFLTFTFWVTCVGQGSKQRKADLKMLDSPAEVVKLSRTDQCPCRASPYTCCHPLTFLYTRLHELLSDPRFVNYYTSNWVEYIFSQLPPFIKRPDLHKGLRG